MNTDELLSLPTCQLNELVQQLDDDGQRVVHERVERAVHDALKGVCV
jgi:hypothetical protein